MELRRNVLKGRKRKLPTIAAHPKLRMSHRRVGKTLSHPMKSLARRALNDHFSKVMNNPCRVKRTACNGKLKEIYYLVKKNKNR
jgi:hypothetical protein